MGTLREQWELLILRPLSLLRPESPQQPLLLVIDALDECEGDRDVRLFLQLLASANTHIPTIQLRVLVTNRPDTPIHLGCCENPGNWHRDLVLDEIPREVVDLLPMCERIVGNGRSQTMFPGILSRIETMSRRRGVFAFSCISKHHEAHKANIVETIPLIIPLFTSVCPTSSGNIYSSMKSK